MPKETVHDVAGMYDVQVGWAQDKWLQVGIESHDGRTIAEHLAVDGEEAAAFKGPWGTLDRAGVNRLIRVLRRARDQAFGRDE